MKTVQAFTSTAIQEAIDAAAVEQVFMPNGRYLLSEPIKIRKGGIALLGERHRQFDRGGVTLIPQGWNGPLIHCTPGDETRPAFPFTDALVGTGNALRMSPATMNADSYIDLQDAVAANVDGLGALTIEFFFRLDSWSAGFMGTLMGSRGTLGTTLAQTCAYEFYILEGGKFIATLNVNGEQAGLATPANTVQLGVVYHIALVYDGSAANLWFGEQGQSSTLAVSQAVSGPIRQRFSEIGYIGGKRISWPKGGVWTNPIDGAIDSIRFTGSARYTAPFTAPSAKLGSDSVTMFLENFDNETIDWSIVQTSLGPTYLPKYHQFIGHVMDGLEFGNFELHAQKGMGICAIGAIEAYYHDMFTWGGVYGFNLWSNNFLSRFERVACSGYAWSKIGLLLSGAGGISSLRDIKALAYDVPFFADNSSGTIQTAYLHGQTIFHMVLRTSDFSIYDAFLSNEDNSAAHEAGLVLVDCRSVSMIGGVIERYINNGPAIRVAGGNNITLINPQFMMHSGATEAIHFDSASEFPVAVMNHSWGPPNFPRNIPLTTTVGAVREV